MADIFSPVTQEEIEERNREAYNREDGIFREAIPYDIFKDKNYHVFPAILSAGIPRSFLVFPQESSFK